MKDIDVVPSNVQSARQEALLYVFEDNEAVIKMIIKGRSPTMRHVSRTHRVALDWLFDRIILDPKIQIKYIDTKNQLADMLPKGNFTRDEWNHLVCLFDIEHFSSTECSETMAKRLQHDSGEERVTAKSRPMMNLIARTPLFVPSSTSFSEQGEGTLRKSRSMECNEGEDRSGRPDKGTDLFEASDQHYHEQFMESFSSTRYSKLDDRPCLVFLIVENRKVTMESATFMGVNAADLTLKQMFDISAKLVTEQDAISGLETLGKTFMAISVI